MLTLKSETFENYINCILSEIQSGNLEQAKIDEIYSLMHKLETSQTKLFQNKIVLNEVFEVLKQNKLSNEHTKFISDAISTRRLRKNKNCNSLIISKNPQPVTYLEIALLQEEVQNQIMKTHQKIFNNLKCYNSSDVNIFLQSIGGDDNFTSLLQLKETFYNSGEKYLKMLKKCNENLKTLLECKNRSTLEETNQIKDLKARVDVSCARTRIMIEQLRDQIFKRDSETKAAVSIVLEDIEKETSHLKALLLKLK